MIKKSKKGWVIESSGYSEYYKAYEEGQLHAQKLLLRYEHAPESFDQTTNLDEDFNEWMNNGEYLEGYAQDLMVSASINGEINPVKVLAKGHIIR